MSKKKDEARCRRGAVLPPERPVRVRRDQGSPRLFRESVRILCGVALLAFCALHASGAEPARNSCAVIQFTALGCTREEALKATDAFRAELTATGVFSVVQPERLKRILAAHKLDGFDNCDNRSCARVIAATAGIDRVVVGEIVKAGKEHTVRVTLVDAGSGGDLRKAHRTVRGGCKNIIAEALPVLAGILAGTQDAETGTTEETQYTSGSRRPFVIGLAGGLTAGALGVLVTWTVLSKESDTSREQDESPATKTVVFEW